MFFLVIHDSKLNSFGFLNYVVRQDVTLGCGKLHGPFVTISVILYTNQLSWKWSADDSLLKTIISYNIALYAPQTH